MLQIVNRMAFVEVERTEFLLFGSLPVGDHSVICNSVPMERTKGLQEFLLSLSSWLSFVFVVFVTEYYYTFNGCVWLNNEQALLKHSFLIIQIISHQICDCEIKKLGFSWFHSCTLYSTRPDCSRLIIYVLYLKHTIPLKKYDARYLTTQQFY